MKNPQLEFPAVTVCNQNRVHCGNLAKQMKLLDCKILNVKTSSTSESSIPHCGSLTKELKMLDDMNDLELKREKGEVLALYNLTGCTYDKSLNFQSSVGASNSTQGQANTGIFIMSDL